MTCNSVVLSGNSCGTLTIDDGTCSKVIEVNVCSQTSVNQTIKKIIIPTTASCLEIYDDNGTTLLFKICKDGNVYVRGRYLTI